MYSLDGFIIHAVLNYPGSWNDRRVTNDCRLIKDHIMEKNATKGMDIICDSSFVVKTLQSNGKIVRSRKSTEIAGIPQSESLAILTQVL